MITLSLVKSVNFVSDVSDQGMNERGHVCSPPPPSPIYSFLLVAFFTYRLSSQLFFLASFSSPLLVSLSYPATQHVLETRVRAFAAAHAK